MSSHPLRTLALLAALAACAGPEARMPEGLTVVRQEEPPPPESAVAEAQRRLDELDLYLGPVNGELSPAVRVALAQFQRTRELEVTGSLDAATADALGLGELASWPAGPVGEEGEAEAPTGPSAAEILELAEVPELPQPPPGALDEARAGAAALLERGTGVADEEVQMAARLLPGEGTGERLGAGEEVRAADEAGQLQQAEPAPAADLLGAELAANRAQGALASAREEAFALLLEARRAGGYAPLPAELIRALEAALQQRSLLLRGADGNLGPDDEAAIRWVQRSVGLEPTGVPSLRLLEALGIEPGAMFRAP